jgi:excisionase family DNA binding protein
MPVGRLLTTAEAAAELAIDPSSVRHAILSGRLPAQKAGRDWLLRPEDVAAYKAKRRRSGRRFGAPCPHSARRVGEATRDDRADRDAAIARLYEAGQTMAVVGARFGISGERVRQVLVRRGVPTRPSSASLRGRRGATPAQQAEILGRRGRDETVTAIAAAVGLSWKVVAAVLRDAGVDTGDRARVNRAGRPRTCTRCLRTERDGVIFSPGESANRCKDCAAATTRAWYRQNAERKKETQRRRRAARRSTAR